VIELTRALAVFAEAPGPEHEALAVLLGLPVPTPAEHADVFLFQVYPYASVQLGPEGKLGGITLDRVAGFFRALDCTVPDEPDHLTVLLGAYATLLERERDVAAWTRAREALLVEHLLPWLPALVRRVRDLAGPAYRAWADLVDELLAAEAARTPLAGTLLPAHLANAEPLPDPRQSRTGDFLDALLAPGRTGVILTASDLTLAAEDLGLGRRLGERQFVIRALLDQDPGAFLDWLSAACQDASEAWDAHWLAGTPIGDWWRDRAASTGRLLGELAMDARSMECEIDEHPTDAATSGRPAGSDAHSTSTSGTSASRPTAVAVAAPGMR
jgi:hypothetical protein